jgi:phage terminase large subunit GpA-like protein
MDAASDPAVAEVLGIFASQTAKTEAILNVIGFQIQHDPAPILFMLPTLELAESWSKDRLAPMLRDCPALQGRVHEARSRDSGNTIRHKTFPGGHLTACGANSPASLASRPIRVLIADEIDANAASAGTEGDPLKLADTRTTAFWNRKRIYITSPRSKGSSPSEKIWARSDQRRFFVPCHACGDEQTLKWAQVQWEKDARGEHLPETACYVCEHCGEGWSDAQRWAAVRRGRWQATRPFTGCAGFHANALVAPWESRRLEALVREWLEAQGNPELLRVFMNTVLAEWWEEKYSTLEGGELLERREVYPERDGVTLAPAGVVVLTAGVDVQDDRLEVQIQGYGVGSEQWKVRYYVIDGDPSTELVWRELAAVLERPIPLATGGADYVRATCVDSGAHTLKVYDFCRPRFRYRLPSGGLAYTFAIKGLGGQAGEFWPRQPNRKNKGRIPLYSIRVDHAKEILYASLAKVRDPGPGFIHFPRYVSEGSEFDQSYFDQLTAEKVIDRRAPNGTIERVWELKSDRRRNEALDTSNYGEAALRGLISMGLDLEKLARQRGIARQAARPDGSAAPDANAAAARTRRRRRRSQSAFLGR